MPYEAKLWFRLWYEAVELGRMEAITEAAVDEDVALAVDMLDALPTFRNWHTREQTELLKRLASG